MFKGDRVAVDFQPRITTPFSTGNITCVLEVGDTAAAHNVIVTIGSKSQPTLLLPGIRVEKGLVIKGWKSTATLTPLNVFGNVNRISS